jgi:hypothetical protein
MLKPVTKEEKLKYTLQLQAEKALDEILGILVYEEKYAGYVDIWPIIDATNKKVMFKMEHKKILNMVVPLSDNDAIRYLIVPDKGAKMIPPKR